MKKSLLIAFALLFATQAHASLQELIDGVKQNNKEAVLTLLNNGENVNAVNEQGNSALHYAVALNNADMTKLLLQFGADMNISNAQGWTPLKIVEKKKVENVAAILHQAQQEHERLQQARLEQDRLEQARLEQIRQEQEKAAAQIASETAAALAVQPAAAEEAKTAVMAVAETVQPAVEAQPAAAEDTQPAAEEAQPAATKAEPAAVEAQPKEASAGEINMISQEDADALYNILEQAKIAVLEAKSVQEETEERNRKLEGALKQLLAQNAVLTQRIAEYENAERAALEAQENARKAAEEAKAKEIKAAEEAKAKQEARKAELEKNAPKPVVKKPVYRPRMSELAKGLYAGDEEIVYCLSYFGNGENTNMRQAGGFFAASANISEARYQQIVSSADTFFAAATAAELQKRSDDCAKLITPKNPAKQNQILRSINRSMK